MNIAQWVDTIKDDAHYRRVNNYNMTPYNHKEEENCFHLSMNQLQFQLNVPMYNNLVRDGLIIKTMFTVVEGTSIRHIIQFNVGEFVCHFHMIEKNKNNKRLIRLQMNHIVKNGSNHPLSVAFNRLSSEDKRNIKNCLNIIMIELLEKSEDRLFYLLCHNQTAQSSVIQTILSYKGD